MDRRDRRGWELWFRKIEVERGVRGGVIGIFDRFVTLAAKRWRGVRTDGLAVIWALRSEVLDLTANGIRDGREAEDEAAEKHLSRVLDFGVEAPARLKENSSFNFSIVRGRQVSVTGVEGSSCSAEPALDMEGVNPGIVFCEAWLPSVSAGSWIEAGCEFPSPSFLDFSSKIAILAPAPNPSASGRLRMTSSTESSEKMLMSCFLNFLPRLFLPTVGLGSGAVGAKNRLRPSSTFGS